MCSIYRNTVCLTIQRNTDTPLLLTKNQVKAIKSMVFEVTKEMFHIKKIEVADFDAWSVDLSMVLVWAIREQRVLSADRQ